MNSTTEANMLYIDIKIFINNKAMKTIVFTTVIFIFSAISLFAHKGWQATVHPADELRNTKEYISYAYKDEYGNEFIFWSHYKNDFRICCAEGIFDYHTSNYSNTGYFDATIGYYDNDDNLVKKEKITMRLVNDNGQIAEKGALKKGNVVKYLKEGVGYIRILAPQFEKVGTWEIKVPCKGWNE